jgi:transcriptional regulator with XRE-family HTH domain
MPIGQRLKDLREEKGLSQGDIERETGLPRTYLSRVENGRTIPTIGTLEKWTRALKTPLYLIFYQGKEAPQFWENPRKKMKVCTGILPEMPHS